MILKDAISRHDHDLNFLDGLRDRYRKTLTKWEANKNTENTTFSVPLKKDRHGAAVREEIVAVNGSISDDERPLEFEDCRFQARMESLLIV